MYLTVRSGTSPLDDVPGGLSCSDKSEQGISIMKVLLTNGSPHREGDTYTALCEVSKALNQNGIDSDIR